MRSECEPFSKRIVSLMAVFLVLLLLLTVCGTAGSAGANQQQFQTIPFHDFPHMNEQQREELADRISWMTAEIFKASLDESKTFWTDEQKQAFADWLVENHFISGPCDFDHLHLSNTFSVPDHCIWPPNIATPAQGDIIQTAQGGNTNAYVIDGTTRLTYEEMKSRVEAGEWRLTDEDGKKQFENEVRDNLGPNAKTVKEFYAAFGIDMTDETYYSRMDDKGLAGLAFGGNTTVLIVAQEEPEYRAVDPYPTIYSPDMSDAQKRALLFTLLNMRTEDLAKAFNDNAAALTDEEYLEFLDYLEKELRFLGEDVFRRFMEFIPII